MNWFNEKVNCLNAFVKCRIQIVTELVLSVLKPEINILLGKCSIGNWLYLSCPKNLIFTLPLPCVFFTDH